MTSSPFHIYIITGEASGDYHAGMLLRSLKSEMPAIQARGWGGPELRAAGADIEVDYKDANFMGFVEVAKNIITILGLFRKTKKSILQFKPDALLLVDYPGFNLRMASWAKKHGIPVYYFIAPQVWAWKEKRVQILRACVRKLFVILPFEKAYFEKHKVDVSYYGHPLVDKIKSFHCAPDFRSKHGLDHREVVAILPGSRKQEIEQLLPVYLEATKHDSKYQYVVSGLNHHRGLYEAMLHRSGHKATVLYNDMYSLLSQARTAIVTSGTASLETALFEVPEVVCYKGHVLSYWIAKKLVKVKYICLANLIADRKIIEELIQDDCNPRAVKAELERLNIPEVHTHVKSELSELKKSLSNENTYQLIANEMIYLFKEGIRF